MTLCTPNPLTNPIPVCTETLIFGVTESVSETLRLYIQDITTGRTDYFPATSDVDGNISADLSSYTGMPKHSYEAWATLDSASASDKLNVTIEGTTANTYALRFIEYFDTNGNPLTSATETLTLL